MAKEKTRVLVTFHPQHDEYFKSILEAIPNADIEVALPDSTKSAEQNLAQLKEKMQNAHIVFHDEFDFQKSVPYSEDNERIGTELSRLAITEFKDKTIRGQMPLSTETREEDIQTETKHLSVPAVDPENPEFPVVIKEKNSQGGEGVYCLEDKKAFDRIFHSELGEITPGRYEFSKYIEPPGQHFTSYRLLYVGDQLIGAGLFASAHKKEEDIRLAEGESDRTLSKAELWGKSLFTTKGSPLFLNSKKITSNIAQGGKIIPLSTDPMARELDEEDKTILQSVGIDPNNLELDPKLKQKSLEAAKISLKNGGVIQGQDWLQDKNGDFFLKEINVFPSNELILHLFNKGKGGEAEATKLFGREVGKRLPRVYRKHV